MTEFITTAIAAATGVWIGVFLPTAIWEKLRNRRLNRTWERKHVKER